MFSTLKNAFNGLLLPFDAVLVRKSRKDADFARVLGLENRNDVLTAQNTFLQQHCDQLVQQIKANNEQNEKKYALLLNQLEYLMFTRWQIMDRLEEQNAFPRRTHCPLCGENLPEQLEDFRSECIFQGGSLLRHQCPHCDVIFGPEKMFHLSALALAEEYKWLYTYIHESDTQDREVHAFYQLNPTKDGIYLNYGAGKWTNTREFLRNDGWNIYDYEPYAGATENPYVITSPEVLATMKFDGLFSHDLVEHLSDPVKEFRFMASLLKPGGIMNHVTGCWEYRYEFTRFHLYFLLGRSREVLAQKAGLEFLGFTKTHEESLPHFYSCVFRLSALKENNDDDKDDKDSVIVNR